jgi:hypothetical protein
MSSYSSPKRAKQSVHHHQQGPEETTSLVNFLRGANVSSMRILHNVWAQHFRMRIYQCVRSKKHVANTQTHIAFQKWFNQITKFAIRTNGTYPNVFRRHLIVNIWMETAKRITSLISPRDVSKSRILLHGHNLSLNLNFPEDLYVHRTNTVVKFASFSMSQLRIFWCSLLTKSNSTN